MLNNYTYCQYRYSTYIYFCNLDIDTYRILYDVDQIASTDKYLIYMR